MSSTHSACSRCGTVLAQHTATGCPTCGLVPAHLPPAAANSVKLLALGGLTFATLAVLMLGGLGLVLWKCFARQPVAEAGAAEPALVAPDVLATPARTDTTAPVDADVADLARPAAAPAATLAEPTPPEPRRVAETPLVAVKMFAGGVPGVNPERVNAAIAKGVKYLRDTQTPASGSWPGNPPVGYTALAGLALLECNVPADDPQVRRAAAFVRDHSGGLFTTYELALCILFLDRLGDPADEQRIQMLGLRLAAGQNDAGGWTYHCAPVLTTPELKQLLVFLKSHRPPAPLARAIHASPGGLDRQTTAATLPGKQVQDGPNAAPARQVADPQKPEPERSTKVNKPVETASLPKAEPPTAPEKKVTPIPVSRLLPRLQQLPLVQVNIDKGKMPKKTFRRRGDDNSNTQFALMGLWAARRHGVPTEYSLRFAQDRYLSTQNRDGGWGYHIDASSTNTMTCVGLIGLAMGHGVRARVDKKEQLDRPIRDGLTALGGYLGQPASDANAKPPLPNLYFLWSVERVAMLYNLKTIGGKDWYGWGAQALLAKQQDNGSWCGGGYHGSTPHLDTCLALLFLKRSNLVPDLTENLQLRMVIRDPEPR